MSHGIALDADEVERGFLLRVADLSMTDEIRAGVLNATDEDKRAYLTELDVRVRLDVIEGDYCAFVSCVLFEEGREVKLIVPAVGDGRYARRVLTGD